MVWTGSGRPFVGAAAHFSLHHQGYNPYPVENSDGRFFQKTRRFFHYEYSSCCSSPSSSAHLLLSHTAPPRKASTFSLQKQRKKALSPSHPASFTRCVRVGILKNGGLFLSFLPFFLIVFYTRAMECITPAVLQYRVSLLYSVHPNPRCRRVSGGSFQYALVSTGNGTKSHTRCIFLFFWEILQQLELCAKKEK